MYCFCTKFCVQFQFLNKSKHIFLEADYMKKNQLVNQAGLYANTSFGLVLHENFTSLERECTFPDNL